MNETEIPVVNWMTFAEVRSTLGGDFVRILGYFREDGTKSVAAIEDAMRARTASQLVIPAHTLKGESAQFGAEKLSELAEQIETVARRCIERQQEPDELLQKVVGLRSLFEESLAALEKEANPLVERQGFGRRPVIASNQGFGRL